MKKFLSVVLALCLLFSGIVISTSAAGNDLSLGSEIRCRYTGEELVYSYTPKADVDAVLYTKDASDGMDTNLAVYRNDDEDFAEYRDDDDNFYNFCYGTTFEAGYTCTFLINDYYGTPGEFTLVLEEDPVDHYEVKNIPVLTADYMGNYEFSYNGIEVTIHYKDPARDTQTVIFEYSSYAETDDFYVSAEYIIEDDNVFLEVSYMDHAESFEVETNAKKITGFEILTPPNCTTLYKDVDCLETAYFDEETYEIKTFNMYNVFYFGMTARITYEDGSYTDVNYDDNTEFFASLENDLKKQRTSPWGIGKHTVTLYFNGFSDTFEVEVVENPYVKAEITKLPYITSSLLEGNCTFTYDENYNGYYHYNTPIAGIEVTLTDVNGKTRVINEDFEVLMKLHAKNNQESSHWGAGAHTVEVYCGNMLVGTYTYTVSDMYISKLEFASYANAAFYYKNEDDLTLDLSGASVKATLTNGKTTKTAVISYEDDNVTEYGYAVSFSYDYDEVNDNYYYYAYAKNRDVYTKSIYCDIITDSIIDVSITNPPSSLTYINGYGIDLYGMDLTGLEITVTTADNKMHLWKWNDSDKDGYDVFLSGIISITAHSEYISVEYRGYIAHCYPDVYKDISEYSKGVISKNTTLELELNRPELQVYTFTPWTDGIYNFTVEGKPLTILGIFDEYSSLITALTYEEQLLTNVEKETYSMEFNKGETYYILVEGLGLFGEFEDGSIDFTVDCETFIVFGDLDGDGEVTTRDVLATRKYLGGLIELTEAEEAAADCDGDGEITTKDVLAMRKYLGGLIDELPIPG